MRTWNSFCAPLDPSLRHAQRGFVQDDSNLSASLISIPQDTRKRSAPSARFFVALPRQTTSNVVRRGFAPQNDVKEYAFGEIFLPPKGSRDRKVINPGS